MKRSPIPRLAHRHQCTSQHVESIDRSCSRPRLDTWKGSLTFAGTYAPAKFPSSQGCNVDGEKAGCVAFCVVASGVPCRPHGQV